MNKKIGRPSTFTPEIGAAICDRLASGESMRNICDDPEMPCSSAVYVWLGKGDQETDTDLSAFTAQYARAREAQAEAVFDDLLEIADDGRNDWMDKQVGREVVRVPDPEALQRSRLRVDTRKWILARMKPKRYGDKITQELTGQGGSEIKLTVVDGRKVESDGE